MLATLISGGYRRELALIFDARGRGLNNPAIQEHKVQAPVDRLRFRRHPLFETDYSQPFSSQKKKYNLAWFNNNGTIARNRTYIEDQDIGVM